MASSKVGGDIVLRNGKVLLRNGHIVTKQDVKPAE